MTKVLIIIFLLTSCQSRNKNDGSALEIDTMEVSCDRYIRTDNLVQIKTDEKAHFVSGEGPMYSSTAETEILAKIEGLNNTASLHLSEPLIDFRKTCSLKCLAYQNMSPASEEECSEDFKCGDLVDFFTTYSEPLGLRVAANADSQSRYPIALFSETDGFWYLMHAKNKECTFIAPQSSLVTVSFFHPNGKMKLELRHDSEKVILLTESCELDPCILSNEELNFEISREIFKHHGRDVDTGKFILTSSMIDGSLLKVKVDDCVVDITSQGKNESYFPNDDLSCLNLEKIKQALIHTL